MKLLNRKATIMEIYSKTLISGIRCKASINGMNFECEFQTIFYYSNGNKKWDLDLYEIVEIVKIEMRNPIKVLEGEQITNFIKFYRDTLNIDYYEILQNHLEDEIKVLLETELIKLNETGF